MRRIVTALTIALLLAGLVPATTLAVAPVAADVNPTTNEEAAVTITLSATDDDGDDVTAFTITSVGVPDEGTLGDIGPIGCTGTVPRTCSADVEYTPFADTNGPDGFSYSATANGEESAAANVSIDVMPINDDPDFTPGPDQVVAEGSGAQSVSAWIASFDPGPSDESGQTASYSLVAVNTALFSNQPAVSASGTLTFTPAANQVGTTSVEIYVTDSGGADSATKSFSISVTGVDYLPVAKNDVIGIRATTTTTLDVRANDSAGAGEPLSELHITSVEQPTLGVVAITAGGAALSFDPRGCTTGSESFDYTVSDGASSRVAQVALTINRPGQAGLSFSPITDRPAVRFITNSTIGTTVPVKLSWCGVTASTTSVRSYKVVQSTDGGSTYPTTLYSAATGRSSTRPLSVNKDYRWKARTTDQAGRVGAYRSSLVSRINRYQNTSAAILYTGTWATSTTSNASGGSERYTNQTGAAATIVVTNRRAFAIIGPKSSTRGSFKVFVDDTLVKTVSERATSTVYRRVLYWRALTSGAGVSHTIRIESAGGGRIDLDAILTLSGT